MVIKNLKQYYCCHLSKRIASWGGGVGRPVGYRTTEEHYGCSSNVECTRRGHYISVRAHSRRTHNVRRVINSMFTLRTRVYTFCTRPDDGVRRRKRKKNIMKNEKKTVVSAGAGGGLIRSSVAPITTTTAAKLYVRRRFDGRRKIGWHSLTSNHTLRAGRTPPPPLAYTRPTTRKLTLSFVDNPFPVFRSVVPRGWRTTRGFGRLVGDGVDGPMEYTAKQVNRSHCFRSIPDVIVL